ncbi:Hypothetical protein NTJ_13370 [Nesidiocoris tenuis]|uniref:Uncharacterized protein n=1 Tax=Nesidiocoris tenuis TaxID=355587 RepID=A0ABN7B8H7_9HEMI|nr:Hypothetical protein NTJ_13370 [Nesidiocoris tenuis]
MPAYPRWPSLRYVADTLEIESNSPSRPFCGDIVFVVTSLPLSSSTSDRTLKGVDPQLCYALWFGGR